MTTSAKPVAIYHEHPDWFRPLFAELERRGLPFARIDASRHWYDPSAADCPYSLVFNRMSPSAYLRGHEQGIFPYARLSRPSRTARGAVVNGRQRSRSKLPSRSSSRFSNRSACHTRRPV